MPRREVLQLGNPALRERCGLVTEFGSPALTDLVQDLHDTIDYQRQMSGYGRAIAAPQVGVLKRIVVLNAPHRIALINPEIAARGEETMLVWDACLSFLCIFMKVRRFKNITVSFQDVEGHPHILEAGPEHDLSELLQHEIDHLDGVLCLDRVEDTRTICTREEFESRYRAESPYGRTGGEQ